MEKRPEREDRHPRTYRLRDEDDARIKALKKLWGCSEVGVIRRLLLDATRHEGLLPTDSRCPDCGYTLSHSRDCPTQGMSFPVQGPEHSRGVLDTARREKVG